MQHYSKLQVWQRSHKLVLELYRTTQTFPVAEQYGLTSQLRRAVLSVPTNIAEGSRRVAAKEYAHFLNIAEGSLSETEYLILVSRYLGYVADQAARSYLREASELLRMLHVFRRKVQSDG